VRHPECITGDPRCPTLGCRRVGQLVGERWQWRAGDARAARVDLFWRASATCMGALVGLALPILLLAMLSLAALAPQSSSGAETLLARGRSLEGVVALTPLYAWAFFAYTAALAGARGRLVLGGLTAGLGVSLWYTLVGADLLHSIHEADAFVPLALLIVGPPLLVSVSYGLVLLCVAQRRPPLVVRSRLIVPA
jgi:hypothetical protein